MFKIKHCQKLSWRVLVVQWLGKKIHRYPEQRTLIQSNMAHLYTKTEKIITIKIDVIHEAEA